MNRTLVAIDPGAKGGIAIFHGHKDISLHNLETDLDELYAQLWIPAAVKVMVEDVGYHRAGNHAQSSATFARHCGHIDMALTAHDLDFAKVKPEVWMRNALGAGRPRNKTERKIWIKKRVQAMFPQLKVTLQTADALGILVYLAQIQGVDFKSLDTRY